MPNARESGAPSSSTERLQQLLALVRQLSTQIEPHDLLSVFRQRAHLVLPHDRHVSVTRLGAEGCALRLVATSHPEQEFDPWHSDDAPTIESGLACELIQQGRPVRLDELRIDNADPLAPYVGDARSMVACPLFHEGEPLHLVMMLRAEPAAFTDDDLATLLMTGNLVGQATQYSVLAARLREAYEAVDREARAVGTMQRNLLPRSLPEIPRIRLAAYYETSTRASGDYYDFFALPDGNWGVLIADVSGHGVPAAVVMARMHALLHAPMATCPQAETSPRKVLGGLNRCLYNTSRAGNFVTALYGVFSPERRTLCYASAGHHPPRWYRRAQGRVAPLESQGGMPLAVAEEAEIAESEACFSAGDRLLLYTDGIIETFSPEHEQFGLERLDAVIGRHGDRDPQSLLDGVMEAVRRHAHEAAPEDDRTLLAVAFD